MATVAQLAARREKLLDDLRKVNEEIALRAGEVDQPEPPAKPKSRRATD